jgi:hypothetical protein
MALDTVNFPKRVSIENRRLTVFYYGCLFCMFVVLVTMFFRLEQYAKQVPMAGNVHVNMWPTGLRGSDAILRVLNTTQQNFKKPFCVQPHDYDFNWDKRWTYVNHTCLPFCLASTSTAQGDCFTYFDMFLSEASDQLFLSTSVQKTFVPDVLGTAAPSLSNYFIPATESLGIGLTYNFDIPPDQVRTVAGVQSRLMGNSQSLSGSSTENVMTVMIDHEDKPFKIAKPSEGDIELTVPQLSAMAGKPDWLDSVGSHPNAHPNAKHATGPLTRISGATVALEVKCYNEHHGDIDHLLNGETWDGPTCYLGAKDANKWYPWSSYESRKPGQNANGVQGTEHRLYHGLRIVAKGDGVFKVYDLNNIYLTIVSYLVLMGLPKTFILFVAVTLLGHFSRIYRGVIYEQFNIEDQVAGMATRLMSNSVNFVDLEDNAGKDSGSGSEGISKRMMGERLTEALRHRGGSLQKEELHSFIDFCYRAVSTKKDKKGMRASKSFLWHSVFGKDRTSNTEDPEDCINIDCFNKACSSLDKMRFEEVVELFDRDRRIRLPEAFFMPPYMRKWLRDVDHRRKVSQGGISADDDDLEKSVRNGDKSVRSSLRPGDMTARSSMRQGDLSARSSVQTCQSEGSVADEMVVEKPSVSSETASTCSSVESACDLHAALKRVKSVDLNEHLAKHFETVSKIVESGQVDHLTVEQRKSLPQLMLHALRDMITREQATHHRVHDAQADLQEFGNQLEELQGLQKISISQFPDKLKAVEEGVQSQVLSLRSELLHELAVRTKDQELNQAKCSELKTPLAQLASTVDELRRELESTRSALKDCQGQLVQLSSESGSAEAEHPALKANPKPVQAHTPHSLNFGGCCSARGGR